VTVEISNSANLQRVKSLLGAKSNEEAMEMALEKVIELYEPVEDEPRGDFPDEYWDDLFSDPPIPSSAVIKAISDECEDRF